MRYFTPNKEKNDFSFKTFADLFGNIELKL